MCWTAKNEKVYMKKRMELGQEGVGDLEMVRAPEQSKIALSNRC